MDRFKQILEVFIKDHGISSFLCFLSVALFSGEAGVKNEAEPGFLGDNAPYSITEKMKQRGPRG